MEGNGTTPSPPALKIPQSPLGLDLVKAAFVAIFGVVITVILEQLAKYIMAWLNQPVPAEPAAQTTVPPPPPAAAEPAATTTVPPTPPAAAEPAAPTTVPPPLPPQEYPQENDLELGS